LAPLSATRHQVRAFLLPDVTEHRPTADATASSPPCPRLVGRRTGRGGAEPWRRSGSELAPARTAWADPSTEAIALRVVSATDPTVGTDLGVSVTVEGEPLALDPRPEPHPCGAQCRCDDSSRSARAQRRGRGARGHPGSGRAGRYRGARWCTRGGGPGRGTESLAIDFIGPARPCLPRTTGSKHGSQ